MKITVEDDERIISIEKKVKDNNHISQYVNLCIDMGYALGFAPKTIEETLGDYMEEKI